MDDPSEWKVDRLKQELRDRGAKTTGRKADLFERLMSYRRNDNFAAGPAIDLPPPSPMPEFPPTASFQSLTASDRPYVPPISKSHVQDFLAKYLVKDANLPTSVAMGKAEKMVAENIMAASFKIAKTNDNNVCFFLTGIVNKSMRKLSYNTRVVINVDSIEITATECDCPVGIGPTAACKHVLGMLLMLAHFSKTGELLVQLSCTETLQTFKRPSKMHEGPPVKVQDLGKGAPDYDPRPKRFRNMENYTDLVDNETINFCAQSNMNITLRYAISNKRRADKSAIVHDHHYVGCLDMV